MGHKKIKDCLVIKIIPHDIQKILNNPISLAVWYMDDGSLDYRPKYHHNASISNRRS